MTALTIILLTLGISAAGGGGSLVNPGDSAFAGKTGIHKASREEVSVMPIELNEEQQNSLDTFGETHPRVIDPRTSDTYVLIPSADYEAVREVLEDGRRQRAVRALAVRNAAGRLAEDR